MIIWPRNILKPETEEWQRPGVFTSGGRLVSGAMKGGRTDGGGLWTCTHAGLVLERNEIKLWRALQTVVGDGVTTFILPMCEAGFSPAPLAGLQLTGIPHSDGSFFSDGAGYSQGSITASISVSAVRRATTIILDMTVSGPLKGGERFSIDHPTEGRRMYSVGQILDVSGTLYTITTDPLREAVTAGTAVDFNTPSCLMQVADPNTMGLKVVSNSWAEKDITFVEAF